MSITGTDSWFARLINRDSTHDTPDAQARENERARSQARARLLATHSCPGCNRHCTLVHPRCAHGFEVQAKRLATAGLAERIGRTGR